MFPKIGVPQNGWFIMEICMKMDHLGVPPFKETPIYHQLKHHGSNFPSLPLLPCLFKTSSLDSKEVAVILEASLKLRRT